MTTPPQATQRDIARNVSEDRGALRLEITGLERRINHLQQKTNQHLIHLAVAIGLVALIAFAAVLMASQGKKANTSRPPTSPASPSPP